MRRLNNAVCCAVKQTLTSCKNSEGNGNYTQDNELLMETFNQNLLSQIQAGDEKYDENLDVTVDFLGAEYDKGLLSVKVSEKYTGLFGRVGQISAQATGVIDRVSYA